MSAHRAEIPARFSHCDPAGRVFYPRYLEMFNNLVEDWRRKLNLPFREIQAGCDLGPAYRSSGGGCRSPELYR